jgi:hypothetical protein
MTAVNFEAYVTLPCGSWKKNAAIRKRNEKCWGKPTKVYQYIGTNQFSQRSGRKFGKSQVWKRGRWWVGG